MKALTVAVTKAVTVVMNFGSTHMQITSASSVTVPSSSMPSSSSSSSKNGVWEAVTPPSSCSWMVCTTTMMMMLLIAYLMFFAFRPYQREEQDEREYQRIEAMLGRHTSIKPTASASTNNNLNQPMPAMEETEEDDEDAIMVEKKDFMATEAESSSSPSPSSALPSSSSSSPSIDLPLSFHLPVMSFNIRYDGEEHDISNHFTRRLPRIQKLFERIQPWIVGLQEALNGQLIHLQSQLNPRYQASIYRSPDGSVVESNCAILYDADVFELRESLFQWMSETPHVPHSKSWDARDARSLNMVRLEFKPQAIRSIFEQQQLQGADKKTVVIDYESSEFLEFESRVRHMPVLAFNTHMDVHSETARRQGSLFIGREIQKWKNKFPHAFVVLTGDFNTGVGQKAYHHLTNPIDASINGYEPLVDSWVVAPSKTQDVINSFHSWRGNQYNVPWVKFVMIPLLTLHGLGMKIPLSMLRTRSDLMNCIWNLFTTAPKYSFKEALPQFPFHRMHVDWVLYRAPNEGEKKSADASSSSSSATSTTVPTPSSSEPLLKLAIEPVQVSLLDVRSSNFSSDHYPLVALFRIKQE